MKFNLHLSSCASSNTRTARRRESLRMACLALGFEQLGHDVSIVDAPAELMTHRPDAADPECDRWTPVKHLYKQHIDGGIEIHPAEILKGHNRRIDVAFKCSVGTGFDVHYLDHSQLLVAHEYNPVVDGISNLLPVPFMVHDSVMDEFIKDGMFEAFIRSDIGKIRDFYGRSKTGLLGSRMCRHHHRSLFIEDAPPWADLGLYTHQPTEGFVPGEHIRWSTQFRGGLCLPGTTPKSNLPPLLALFGVAIVSPAFPPNYRDTPPISKSNAIIFESWEQVRSELENEKLLAENIEQATVDYCECWSPCGQARLIAERFS